MRNSNAIISVGIFLMLIPFLGLPTSWKNFFLIMLGVWLCSGVFFARQHRAVVKRASHKRVPSAKEITRVENIVPIVPTDNQIISQQNEQTPQV